MIEVFFSLYVYPFRYMFFPKLDELKTSMEVSCCAFVIYFSFIDSRNSENPSLIILIVDNSLYHTHHLNQIGLRSIQCCLQVKSFLIKMLFNFSICFVRLTLINKVDSSVINIQHRQDRSDRVRFYIEFTKIGVEILKGKGYAVSIV